MGSRVVASDVDLGCDSGGQSVATSSCIYINLLKELFIENIFGNVRRSHYSALCTKEHENFYVNQMTHFKEVCSNPKW